MVGMDNISFNDSWRGISIHYWQLKCVQQKLLAKILIMFTMSLPLLCWWVVKSFSRLCFLTFVKCGFYSKYDMYHSSCNKSLTQLNQGGV